MKKIILGLFLVLTTLSADIEWLEYDDAIDKAQKENKIVMVMLGRSSCSVCKYMKTVVFKDKKIIPILNKKFLSVYIELDFDDVPEGLTYVGTPTFHFLDKNEKAIYRIDGGKTVPSFFKAITDEIN